MARHNRDTMTTPSFLQRSSAPHAVLQDPWFSSLPEGLQQSLLQACTSLEIGAGAAIIAQGQALAHASDGFYVLIEGELSIDVVSPAGRTAILSLVKPGQWFGEISLADAMSRECSVQATGKSVLGVVTVESFTQLMKDPPFAAKISELLSSRTRLYMSIVEDFVLRSARSRTARRLLLLSRSDNLLSTRSHHVIHISHSTLASMLGMTRQTLGQQLRSLSDIGAITQSYGSIEIISSTILMSVINAG